MEKLGNLLVKKGAIEPVQLLDGLRTQQKRGGRLGTNLVERRHLSLEMLTRTLGEQRGMPVVMPDELMAVPEGALVLVSASVAEQFLAVPLGTENRTLVVAMASAFDPDAVDALERALRCRVVARLAAELVVLRALERFYGLDVRSPPWNDESHVTTPADEPAPRAADPSVFKGLAPGEFLTSEDDNLYQRAGPGTLEPVAARKAPRPVAPKVLVSAPPPPPSPTPGTEAPAAEAPVWPPPEEVPVLPAAAAPQPDSGPDWMIEAPATAPAPVERTPIARQVTEKVPGRPVAPTAPEAGLDWVIEAPPDEPQKR